MVFIRWNWAGVAVAIGAIRIVGFVEIEHQFVVDNVFDPQIKVATTAVSTFSIAEVLEGDEEVIPVLRQGISQTAVDAELMFYSIQLEFGDSVTNIRAGDPTIGWQLKWLGIGRKAELAGHKIVFIGREKLNHFKPFFAQRGIWAVFKRTQVGFAVLGDTFDVQRVGLPHQS